MKKDPIRSNNAPSPMLNLSRRSFTAGLGASVFVLAGGGLALPLRAEEAEPKYGGEGMPHGLNYAPKVFIGIETDGRVRIVCHRAEMGQGVRTSLPMVVADELEADWARVEVVQAEGDALRYGNQDTDGSRSMRHHFITMRQMGAAARLMLAMAAAKIWGVKVDEVTVEDHHALHTSSGRKLGFGELASAAAELPVPSVNDLKLKEPKAFKYIGKEDIQLVDNFDITTGRAQFGIDTQMDDMVYAVIARPPVYGGKVGKFDAAKALKISGVLKVVELPSPPPPTAFQALGGVAVIATNTWAAIKGREALEVSFEHGPNEDYTTDSYRKKMTETAKKAGKVVRATGNVDEAMKAARKRVAASYYTPHHPHATMEPPVAVAKVESDKCEAWAPLQNPQAALEGLMKMFDLPKEAVRVNVTLLGGGFGRKSKPDFVFEAALLSKAMGGKPVKVTWTREDDIRHDYLNTTAVEHIEAGLDDDGKTVAWLHRSVAPSIMSIFQPNVTHEAPFELGLGLIDAPFSVPNIRLENGAADAHARIGWFRSVTNIPHAFAIQSFIHELAVAAGRDPKDYLLEMIGPPRRLTLRKPEIKTDAPWWNYGESPEVYAIDTGRLSRVAETVAQAAGWGRKMAKGSGLGIAAHRSFVTYTAAVVEVSVDDSGAITVPRVDIAVDCGPRINPDRIRSQMEGSVVQGCSIALMSDISFNKGQVEQSNFDSFEVARMESAPRDIRVHLVGDDAFDAPLGGVGEPGLPPVVPALVNAVFAATGQRIRSLPIGDQLSSG